MVALVVAVYVALGFIFRPNANAYLLLGMPITVLFQLCVARRPLRELWLREGQPFRFDRWTAALLVVLLIGPVEAIVQGVRGSDWAVTAYGCAALLGAVGAALSFRVLGRARLRQLVILLVIAVPLALARLLAALVLAGGNTHELAAAHRLWLGVQSLLFYVPAVFVAEEVLFRGAFDSYLHRRESGAGWASAAFVSILWGLWHTPIAGSLSVPVVVELVLFQLALGLILSWLWRQTGNLAMPGTVHAIVDGVRNAIQP